MAVWKVSAYLRVLLGDVSPEGVADNTATFSKSLGIAEKDFVKFIDQIQKQNLHSD